MLWLGHRVTLSVVLPHQVGDVADLNVPGVLGKIPLGLELIAESLLEHETVDGPTVARLIQQGMIESGESAPTLDDIVLR